MRRVSVAINAQFEPGGRFGGMEQFMTGLLYALGRWGSDDMQYVVVGPSSKPAWMKDYLGENQRIVAGPSPQQPARPSLVERGKRLLGPARRPLAALRRRVLGQTEVARFCVPDSGGFFESLDVDVVHFPYQDYIRCELPTIFNPHDLQHLHFPEFFPEERIAWREHLYRFACAQSRVVVAESQWAKDDLVKQYHLSDGKIVVIRRGAPTALYDPPSAAELDTLRRQLSLPSVFALYPAKTYPHKNHAMLFRAIHLLREQFGQKVHLVCPGTKSDYWPTLENQLDHLKLHDQVLFPGFVSGRELRGLYRLARCLVFPTLFEGAGFPLIEAFHEGLPVACSDIPVLRESGGNAACYFHPGEVESIARVLQSLFFDDALRQEKVRLGRQQLEMFSWQRMGRTYRSLYRQVAGQRLSSAEQAMLKGG